MEIARVHGGTLSAIDGGNGKVTLQLELPA
jgi:hypothetical protein